MPVKAIIFDLFGVLFKDRWQEWKSENEEALKEYLKHAPDHPTLSLPLTYPEYYNSLICINTDERNTPPLIDDDEFYSILEKASNKPAESIKAALHNTPVLNRELVPIIHNLKYRGFKLGLIANGDQDIKDEFLFKNNLTSLFDQSITSAEVGKQKPDSLIFEKIADLLQVALHEMLLIDDSQDTMQAVQCIGIQSIHYYYQDSILLQQEIEQLSRVSLGI